MSKHSEACCRIPPVVVEGYQPKGKYIDLDGIRAYVTGPADSSKAILSVYDIFGYFPQTLQGADILAEGDGEQKYQVFFPDFFAGNPAKLEWYPPTDEDKKTKLWSWFEEYGVWPKHKPKIPGLVQAAEKFNTKITSWGIMGYCWGGKMASLLAGEDPGLFKVAVQTSPAMIDPEDALKVKIPTMLIASQEEAEADVRKYEEKLKVAKHIEMFSDQLHGFMSARGDLNDAKVKAEYERGYRLAVGFFHEHL